MTAADVLVSLQADGVELSCVGDQLKVNRKKGRITEEQKKLVSAYKADLLALLNPPPATRNPGSPEPMKQPSTPTPPKPNIERPEPAETFFKTYILSNGETLNVTKEEFDQIVEACRLLLKQETKLSRNGRVA